jgi:hypothetical protein
MRCKDCSRQSGRPFKRSHLVALRSTKISAFKSADNMVAGRALMPTCTTCSDSGWVCEEHPVRPWDGDHACGWGAAGMPCVRCNPSDLDNPPRPPAGTRIEFDRLAALSLAA